MFRVLRNDSWWDRHEDLVAGFLSQLYYVFCDQKGINREWLRPIWLEIVGVMDQFGYVLSVEGCIPNAVLYQAEPRSDAATVQAFSLLVQRRIC